MRPVLALEVKKAFTNKLFLLSLLLASALALYSAVFCIISHYKFVQMDLAAGAITSYTLNPELPGSSLFTQWIGKEFISPAGSLFYL